MDTKKKIHPILRIILLLFFLYLIVFCLSISGYYENKMHTKTMYTNNQIKAFEEDIKNGKEIDLNRYLLEDEEDYSNIFTRVSDHIGEFINSFMSGGIDETVKVLKTLFG